MNLNKIIFSALIGFFVLISFNGPARSAVIVFDLAPFTGDPAKAKAKIDDNTAGLFRFNVQVTPEPITGNIGDITGVFFDFSPLVTLSNITSVKGGSILGFGTNTNNLGNGVNLIGGGPSNPGLFDVGLRYAGFNVDDVQEVEFTIDRTDPDLSSLTLANFTEVGLRLQTVGPAGTSRGGSSKLADLSSSTDSTPSVPEPTTLVLMGLGFLGSALGLKSRK